MSLPIFNCPFFMSFVGISSCLMSLFQGPVTCWNFTLTGPLKHDLTSFLIFGCCSNWNLSIQPSFSRLILKNGWVGVKRRGMKKKGTIYLVVSTQGI